MIVKSDDLLSQKSEEKKTLTNLYIYEGLHLSANFCINLKF